MILVTPWRNTATITISISLVTSPTFLLYHLFSRAILSMPRAARVSVLLYPLLTRLLSISFPLLSRGMLTKITSAITSPWQGFFISVPIALNLLLIILAL
ncbi:hypothetical protein PanWU01x14_367020 [Parasponia andersonii]|uniref:Transmembrane protein n=1 Tax=Parasponia andersonii TaxID=3476 RepID=A0A2P5A5H0_PARAD|nr:hypothetical protein PanWU01x14_367020 [Parasponia andersonii]